VPRLRQQGQAPKLAAVQRQGLELVRLLPARAPQALQAPQMQMEPQPLQAQMALQLHLRQRH